jgi:O-antigen/teichoic acid export membrane protein
VLKITKVDRIKQIFSSRYLRNVGWLGAAELFNRIFRLATTVTLARVFSTEEYGLMAVIYTTIDFATVFTFKHGISAKIIQTDEKNLTAICNTCYWLNWLLCGSILIIQCLLAFVIVAFYGDRQLILPLCVVSLIYLIFPFFLVNCAIIERENRLKVTAICNAVQSLVSNTLTVIFIFMGMGIWAIVWAIILSNPVWVFVTWKYSSWRPPKRITFQYWREITNFGKNLLGVEILNKLRMNLDYLIVGRFLGVDALGMYFFAFNAGSGITNNVVYALMSALFPHLCAVKQNLTQLKQQYYKSLKSIASIIVPLVILQSSLSPLYVPIIFGQKWIAAIPILITICLSVIPRTFSWAASMLLNSVDKTHVTLRLDFIFTVIFAIAILVAVNFGIYWVAAAVLLSQAIVLPIFTYWATKQVFANN